MKKLLLFFIILNFSSGTYGQINLNVEASVSNLLRYGSGYEYTGSLKNSKEYFENLTDARLNVNGVTFGMRYQISQPREYGNDFLGIDRRFVQYEHESGISFTAGDYWDIISRGLSLNVFEDWGLAYDTGIDGVRIKYKNTFGKKNPVKFMAQLIGGNIDYSDYLLPERIEKYRIRNAYGEISPVKPLTIGLGYVYSTGDIPEEGSPTLVKTDLPEINFKYNIADFEFYAAYSHKTSLISPNEVYTEPQTAKGDGLYSSVSYSHKNTGITLEYKNYRYDITLPDNRSNTRPSRMLPYQNPPTAKNEQLSTLMSRNPHVVDFNDEVGGMLDIVYSPTDKLSFELNGSIASRHYEYTDTNSSGIVSYERVDRSDSYLPSLDDPFYPFWEIFFQGENYASDELYYKAGISTQNSVIYNQIYPDKSEKIISTTFPFEIKYSFSKIYTVTFIGEQQWVYNSLRTNSTSFNYTNQFFSLSLSKSPDMTLTVNAESTNDDEEPTGKNFWWLGEATYKINESNSVLVSYGSERGGLRCANGICRFVKPFEGFRLAVQTLF
ncbi:MAG: hypothetical protein JNJ56_07770 [Ignavibacteria bacterium]|nr:hypothetical protein [Ignavibacteria bacterium]